MTSLVEKVVATPFSPRVSVVLCCYTMTRWPRIVEAVDSVLGQSLPADEVVVVVDHCPELLAHATTHLSGVRVVRNLGPQGLSGARNTGVAEATGDVVAFLDDDAAADVDWLRSLVAEYRDPEVLGVGGHVEPDWEEGRPAWFPPEFDWVVGCSHSGLSVDRAVAVRNLIGANMSFRRETLTDVGGFRHDLGRVGTRPVGCEETELCIRAAARFPGGVLRYQPSARVRHHVPADRGRWAYFRERCYAEGLSKAMVSRFAGATAALASERDYVRRVLPRGVRASARTAPARAATILGGLAFTTSGYAIGRLEDVRSRRRLPTLPPPWRSPALQLTPLALALVLWLTSLRGVDLRGMTDVGLVAVLPGTYWVALGTVLLTLAGLIHRNRAPPAVLVGYLAALVLVLHATPALLYGSLRYAWAWKHVGVVEYLVRHHGLDPHTGGPFSVYHAWPGFFALNGLLEHGSGLTTALSYAAWAPVVVGLSVLAPLYLLFTTLTSDRRQVWLALLVFCLGNWVGQDYFSPQAFAYLLYLLVLVVCLRHLPAPPARHGRLGRWRRWLAPDAAMPEPPSRHRRAVLAVVVLLLVAIVSSHQLTPFMLLSALTLLTFGRHIEPRWLPWLLAGLIAVWIYLNAITFLSENLYWIVKSVGSPERNAQTSLSDLSSATTGQRLVSYAARGLTAGVAVLGAAGLVRLRRLGRPTKVASVLGGAPLLALVANSYGGETLLRVYLFALPFLALLAAGCIYPQRFGSRWAPLLPVGLAVLLVVPFTLAYYGKARINHFTPEEVSASRWLYRHGPEGSMFVGTTAVLPWASSHYENFQYLFLEDLSPAEKVRLADAPLPVLERAIRWRKGPAFVVLAQSQADSVRYTGELPLTATSALESALREDPAFRVVYSNRAATIFETPKPGPEVTP